MDNGALHNTVCASANQAQIRSPFTVRGSPFVVSFSSSDSDTDTDY
jgi:hypothetical protein